MSSQAGNSTQGNRLGCPDDDGDGWDNVIDELPSTPTQWLDQDGDGYGDNATGIEADSCPGEAGTSTVDRFGCLDDDGDGISNLNDAFPDDPTRSQDSDGDGFDDLEDNCISVAGNSTEDRTGCPDTDGDGYSDVTPPTNGSVGWNVSDGADAFPIEPSQWADADGMDLAIMQLASKEMIVQLKKDIPTLAYLVVLMEIMMELHKPMMISQMILLNGMIPTVMDMGIIQTHLIQMLVLQ